MTIEPFPPPNFILTESAISGIEVYRPSLPEEMAKQREVVEFKCPQCGAATAYSASDNGLTCTHCSYYEPPHQARIGTAAENFEFTLETLQRAAQGWGQVRQELQCQDCSAYTSFPPDALSVTCPFCGSHKVIRQANLQNTLRPRFLIPFKIDSEQCLNIARQWLGNSWMTPSILKRITGFNSFTGVYLPFWTFESNTQGKWRAEVGYLEKTEMVWQQQTGQVNQPFVNELEIGSSRLQPKLLAQIKAYDLQQLTPYEPNYLAGFQAQAFDIPLETAWATARRRMREKVKQTCYDKALASGPAFKSCSIGNFYMDLDFTDEGWRYILLPVYLAAFTYRGTAYQVVINGQTGAIAGPRPLDWRKIGLALLLVFSPMLLFSFLCLANIFINQPGKENPFAGLVCVFLLLGLGIGAFLLQSALKANKT